MADDYLPDLDDEYNESLESDLAAGLRSPWLFRVGLLPDEAGGTQLLND